MNDKDPETEKKQAGDGHYPAPISDRKGNQEFARSYRGEGKTLQKKGIRDKQTNTGHQKCSSGGSLLSYLNSERKVAHEDVGRLAAANDEGRKGNGQEKNQSTRPV